MSTERVIIFYSVLYINNTLGMSAVDRYPSSYALMPGTSPYVVQTRFPEPFYTGLVTIEDSVIQAIAANNRAMASRNNKLQSRSSSSSLSFVSSSSDPNTQSVQQARDASRHYSTRPSQITGNPQLDSTLAGSRLDPAAATEAQLLQQGLTGTLFKLNVNLTDRELKKQDEQITMLVADKQAQTDEMTAWIADAQLQVSNELERRDRIAESSLQEQLKAQQDKNDSAHEKETVRLQLDMEKRLAEALRTQKEEITRKQVEQDRQQQLMLDKLDKIDRQYDIITNDNAKQNQLLQQSLKLNTDLKGMQSQYSEDLKQTRIVHNDQIKNMTDTFNDTAKAITDKFNETTRVWKSDIDTLKSQFDQKTLLNNATILAENDSFEITKKAMSDAEVGRSQIIALAKSHDDKIAQLYQDTKSFSEYYNRTSQETATMITNGFASYNQNMQQRIGTVEQRLQISDTTVGDLRQNLHQVRSAANRLEIKMEEVVAAVKDQIQISSASTPLDGHLANDNKYDALDKQMSFLQQEMKKINANIDTSSQTSKGYMKELISLKKSIMTQTSKFDSFMKAIPQQRSSPSSASVVPQRRSSSSSSNKMTVEVNPSGLGDGRKSKRGRGAGTEFTYKRVRDSGVVNKEIVKMMQDATANLDKDLRMNLKNSPGLTLAFKNGPIGLNELFGLTDRPNSTIENLKQKYRTNAAAVLADTLTMGVVKQDYDTYNPKDDPNNEVAQQVKLILDSLTEEARKTGSSNWALALKKATDGTLFTETVYKEIEIDDGTVKL
jgi:hypothetical protein